MSGTASHPLPADPALAAVAQRALDGDEQARRDAPAVVLCEV